MSAEQPEHNGATQDGSIIVCTLDRQLEVARAIRSILAQEVDPRRYEIVVVDNHSRDGTRGVIEEIQREFLFVRGDIEALERQLERVYAAFETAVSAEGHAADEVAARALVEARSTGASLVRKLEEIEHRMTLRARMERAAL